MVDLLAHLVPHSPLIEAACRKACRQLSNPRKPIVTWSAWCSVPSSG